MFLVQLSKKIGKPDYYRADHTSTSLISTQKKHCSQKIPKKYVCLENWPKGSTEQMPVPPAKSQPKILLILSMLTFRC